MRTRWGEGRRRPSVYRPRREASLETDPADILIGQPPEPQGGKSLWFQPPLWSSVTAALEDQHVSVPHSSFLVYDPAPGPVRSIAFKSMTNSLGRRRKQWLASLLPWNERLESQCFLRNSWERKADHEHARGIFSCVLRGSLLHLYFINPAPTSGFSNAACNFLHRLGLGLYCSRQILFEHRLPYANPCAGTDRCQYVCCCCCLVPRLCLTLASPMDCRPPGSSVHGISQARSLE